MGGGRRRGIVSTGGRLFFLLFLREVFFRFFCFIVCNWVFFDVIRFLFF